MFHDLRKSVLITLVLAACSSGANPENQSALAYAVSQANQFKGIQTLNKIDSSTWQMTWDPLDASDVIYSIHVSEPGSTEVIFDQALAVVQGNSFLYEFPSVFAISNICFAVRVLNYGEDVNETSLCIQGEPFSFKGITDMERTREGRYIISWSAIPDPDVYFAIFRRTADGEFDFAIPSIEPVRNTVHTIELLPRGIQYCFVVRFRGVDVEDINTNEVCTELEKPFVFEGLFDPNDRQRKFIEWLDGQYIRISWDHAGEEFVVGYNIYKGNDFKELIGYVSVEANRISYSFETHSLGGVSYGVRAVDVFGREDSNIRAYPVPEINE